MCGMKLLIHSEFLTVQPLKFKNEQVMSYHILLGLYYLSMLGLKLIFVSKGGPAGLC